MEEHVRRYAGAIRTAREAGEDVFHGWFDASTGPGESLVRGAWDFALHVLTPAVSSHLAEPERLTALEIGYGGGRLLNTACGFFGEAIGVDVHDDAETVERFLRANGRTNFRLLQGSGVDLPVPDESVDLVYSFIVLQHLPSWESFASYIRETARCLRPGGLAQLYFAPLGGHGLRGRVGALRRLGRDYLELPAAAVNHTSLRVRPRAVRRLARAHGLEPVASGGSWKRAPDGYPSRRGGQEHVTLVKQTT